ncbi:MAG: hypothetical protein OEW49_04760 [Nitrosopumilus sp.]|nr:hypothetical protein [Nitrosopumilus sp.]
MTKIKKSSDSQTTKSKNLELGERRVSRMNFSYVTTLPKIFVNNFLGQNMVVRATMLEDGSLKLTPISTNKESKKIE